MRYKLENIGAAVKIGDVIIPAVNIQVDNVPGFIEDTNGGAHWYGVYFEVIFENGELWEVTQGDTPEDWNNPMVSAIITEDFGKVVEPEGRYVYEVSWASWGEFLDSYKVNASVH